MSYFACCYGLNSIDYFRVLPGNGRLWSLRQARHMSITASNRLVLLMQFHGKISSEALDHNIYQWKQQRHRYRDVGRNFCRSLTFNIHQNFPSCFGSSFYVKKKSSTKWFVLNGSNQFSVLESKPSITFYDQSMYATGCVDGLNLYIPTEAIKAR